MLGVVCDGLLNLEGQGQGGAGLVGCDLRGGVGLDGLEEGFDFEAKGFTWSDLGFVHAECWQGEG